MIIPAIPSEVIDWNILNEIVSMDEDDPEFSKGLILQYIDQANNTFGEMDDILQGSKNLTELDSLGHFLKGSSAALGLQRIAWVCERIQNLGRKQENSFPSSEELLPTTDANLRVLAFEQLSNSNAPVSGSDQGSDGLYLSLIAKALSQARVEFKLARSELSKYYKSEM